MAKNLNNFFIHNCMDSKSSVWFAVCVYTKKKSYINQCNSFFVAHRGIEPLFQE